MNLRRLVETYAIELKVSAKEVLGKSRLKYIVDARREAMRRLYVDQGRNTPEIAEVFGCRDTSVQHHLRKSIGAGWRRTAPAPRSTNSAPSTGITR